MFQQAATSVSDYVFCFCFVRHCNPVQVPSSRPALTVTAAQINISYKQTLAIDVSVFEASWYSSCSIGTSSCKVWFNKRTSKTCAQVNKVHHARFLNTSSMTQRLSFQQPHALFIHQFIRRVASLPHARSVALGRSATQDALCCFSA